jgi:hypothetical protein
LVNGSGKQMRTETAHQKLPVFMADGTCGGLGMLTGKPANGKCGMLASSETVDLSGRYDWFCLWMI